MALRIYLPVNRNGLMLPIHTGMVVRKFLFGLQLSALWDFTQKGGIQSVIERATGYATTDETTLVLGKAHCY
jgi:hypothetical protein